MLLSKLHRALKLRSFIDIGPQIKSKTSYCLYEEARRKEIAIKGQASLFKNGRDPSVGFRRGYCTPHKFEDPDQFGTLSPEQNADTVEMDEQEIKEEEFGQREGAIPRWQKQSPGKHYQKIKKLIENGELYEALDASEDFKRQHKPTVYLYNLLLYGYAKNGDIKQCLRLYADMRKRGLKPTAATFCTLLQACSTSSNRKMGLENLQKFLHAMQEQSIPMNTAHYNVLIKAYGRLGEMEKAFELADLMTDRGIPFTDITYTSLLGSTIERKKDGLKHTLSVWHLMHKFRVQQNRIHYKLLLRAIRDTQFGDLKVNDTLVPNVEQSRIQLSKDSQTDLLASPPVVGKPLLFLIPNKRTKKKKLLNSGSSTETALSHPDNALTTDEDVAELISQNFDTILETNRMVLFGGFDKFVSTLNKQNITPDIAMISLLLELIPNTISAEEDLIEFASKNSVKPDILFYNMLIRRRAFRKDYKAAYSVLNLIEKSHLTPNIMTFCTLALTCETIKDAELLISEMNTVGYVPNLVFMETLLSNASYRRDTKYAMYVFKYMGKIKLQPDESTFVEADKMVNLIKEDMHRKDTRHRQRKDMKAKLAEFLQVYTKWKEELSKDCVTQV